MAREVVEQKLESLRRCLTRIDQKCPAEAATLLVDFDLHEVFHSLEVDVRVVAHVFEARVIAKGSGHVQIAHVFFKRHLGLHCERRHRETYNPVLQRLHRALPFAGVRNQVTSRTSAPQSARH